MRRTAAVFASGALVLAATGPASASRLSSLSARLADELSASGSTAMSVRVDVAGRGTVFARGSSVALNPASTEKLITGYTALRVLGPAHRFRTRIGSTHAPDREGVLHGGLVVTGGGDPTLGTAGLDDLAHQLRGHGLRAVTGGILLDDTLFARVRYAPVGTTTLEPGDPGPLSAFAVDRDGWRLDAAYRADPSIGNMQALQRALARAGITVHGPLSVGRPVTVLRPLASTSSEPLWAVVRDMLKTSVNFYAEMLLLDVGAARGDGTQPGGVKVIRAEAAKLDVDLGGNMVDGSGLSTFDRQSADGEVSWLEAIRRDRRLGPLIDAGVPIGCVDGSLQHRFCAIAGRVHAKPGSLNGMRSLSGWVTDDGGHLVTFAFLLAGTPPQALQTRNAIDAAVGLLTASTL
jgi:D-alanyl-D-alanine carboxypeptidase/D-alanyl-D-alanine-endopeptidase (penicillin-binding protein 4)